MPESIVPNGHDRAADRAVINRANAQKSTGPRTAAGKQRSSLNALRHGINWPKTSSSAPKIVKNSTNC